MHNKLIDYFQHTILLIILSSTLLFQKYFFISKVAWLLLSILCGINITFAIYAVFFFGAFFVTTDFLPHLFFTVKHFQIAIMLLALTCFFRGKLSFKAHNLARFGKIFLPWLLILLISTLAVLRGDQLTRVFKINGNILSCVLSALLLMATVKVSKENVSNAILFFLFGVCLRVSLAALTQAGIRYYFPIEGLFYNNHIGFLCATTLFLTLPFLILKRGWFGQVLCWFTLGLVCTGLLMSCSRTGWFSFLISYFLFSTLFFSLQESNPSLKSTWKTREFLIGTALMFTVILFLGSFMSRDVIDRVFALQRLFDRQFWNYTFHTDNFGFFGFHRLHQFITIVKIMKQSHLLGIGFTQEVTDFHSLYLTILGGTGVLGLCLFCIFISNWLKPLYRVIFQPDRDGFNIMRIGVLSAFVAWLVYSLMETFVVQFHIWLIVALGFMLQKRVPAKLQLAKKTAALDQRISREG